MPRMPENGNDTTSRCTRRRTAARERPRWPRKEDDDESDDQSRNLYTGLVKLTNENDETVDAKVSVEENGFDPRGFCAREHRTARAQTVHVPCPLS